MLIIGNYAWKSKENVQHVDAPNHPADRACPHVGLRQLFSVGVCPQFEHDVDVAGGESVVVEAAEIAAHGDEWLVEPGLPRHIRKQTSRPRCCGTGGVLRRRVAAEIRA